ncbi:PQQ-dependent sugar dehydrogenase [Tautonia sociabilis]|uniref:Sugar dehydrogenase n=1 Tax=Tautonia sociabilis TaxID=2080755 RepID=A0A432MMC0_9BACT|nr:sugar dehydrogenase [Tautonia sociabilis]RUL88562.1 sugar dehydrogenase [Tautonia sociabilis]
MNRMVHHGLMPFLLLLLLSVLVRGATAQGPEASGYRADRLPLPADVLPSCMTIRPDGSLAVGSMDGDILLVADEDGDGLPETYRRWAGTLPHWPLGLLAEGNDLIVATRAALLRLSDDDEDGWAERWTTITDAWDVTRDHHDWTTGIARWPDGSYVVSPVTDDVRDRSVEGRHFLRGKAIKVDPEDGSVAVLAEGLRYPTGWTTRSADGAVFFTDNQGQQKTNCEINPLVPGSWYGYPSQADPPSGPEGSTPYTPAVLIPYPWARSVNGLAFAETGGRFGPVEGQLVLCEYNNRFILRASLEEVDGVSQGACYPFLGGLLGPLCLAFSPDGTLYVGSIREPSWGAEPEQGAIYRVRPIADAPGFGILEATAEPDGFTLRFLSEPSDQAPALDPSRYSLRRYHHVFQGSYHSPPTDLELLSVAAVEPGADPASVRLRVREPMIPGRIYEIRADLPGAEPDVAHYTMNRVPSIAKEDENLTRSRSVTEEKKSK